MQDASGYSALHHAALNGHRYSVSNILIISNIFKNIVISLSGRLSKLLIDILSNFFHKLEFVFQFP